LATPASAPFYRSTLRTDKGVEKGNIGASCHRYVPGTRLSPMDIELVESFCEDSQNVRCGVAELVPRVLVSLNTG